MEYTTEKGNNGATHDFIKPDDLISLMAHLSDFPKPEWRIRQHEQGYAYFEILEPPK